MPAGNLDGDPKLFKAALLPRREVMFLGLDTAGLYGQTPRQTPTDRFYETFVGLLANSNKNALQVNLAWNEAVAEFRKMEAYLPPSEVDVMVTGISLKFNQVIEAVVPDHELADRVISFRRIQEANAANRKGKL